MPLPPELKHALILGGTITAKLGYEVMVVKDATADYSDEMMHAALDTIFRTTPLPL
jgi:nicotinamidase-related amidase